MSIFSGDRRTPVWGGWVTGPTLIGPEEFARAGYDYVGFDAQHSYLDDADIAAILRRIEQVPIATVVRLPNADPAPIGRVLDAGADGVVIAMIESADQAAAAVAATRYLPRGIRRCWTRWSASIARQPTPGWSPESMRAPATTAATWRSSDFR
jgi:4-hydroxy-2-oxoheptanedioate aldolase